VDQPDPYFFKVFLILFLFLILMSADVKLRGREDEEEI
jgi:hypothetical protein